MRTWVFLGLPLAICFGGRDDEKPFSDTCATPESTERTRRMRQCLVLRSYEEEALGQGRQGKGERGLGEGGNYYSGAMGPNVRVALPYCVRRSRA